jgi:hypothetical protein
MLLIFALSLLSPGLSHSIQLLLHVLATVGSMRGGAPRPNLVAMAVVNRSGSSSPAEGGGEGIAVVAVFERESVYSNEVVCVCVCVCVVVWSKRNSPCSMLVLVQIWSPMAEISTLHPQLEHFIVGKKPDSIAILSSVD